MKNKLHNNNNKLLLRLIYLLLITCIVTSLSMAKFHSTHSPSAKAMVANWNIKINNSDVTVEGATLTNTITLVSQSNNNVAEGKLAPGYGGYFDIVVDASLTDVAIEYTMNMDATNLPTDVEILGYGDETVLDSQLVTAIENNSISGVMEGQTTKTIRIFWMWNDVRDNDVVHTEIATGTSNYNVDFEFIFTQKIG